MNVAFLLITTGVGLADNTANANKPTTPPAGTTGAVVTPGTPGPVVGTPMPGGYGYGHGGAIINGGGHGGCCESAPVTYGGGCYGAAADCGCDGGGGHRLFGMFRRGGGGHHGGGGCEGGGHGFFGGHGRGGHHGGGGCVGAFAGGYDSCCESAPVTYGGGCYGAAADCGCEGGRGGHHGGGGGLFGRFRRHRGGDCCEGGFDGCCNGGFDGGCCNGHGGYIGGAPGGIPHGTVIPGGTPTPGTGEKLKMPSEDPGKKLPSGGGETNTGARLNPAGSGITPAAATPPEPEARPPF